MDSKNSKHLTESIPKGKPSRVMNEDIVVLILSNLDVKQLLQLKSASQQMLFCVPLALKQKKLLSIGNEKIKDNDITKTIVRQEVIKKETLTQLILEYWYDLTASHPMLVSLAAMCPRIQSLDLMFAIVDYPSIALMVNECLRLTSLSMIETKILGLDVPSVQQWIQLLAPRLTQWTVRGDSMDLNTSQELMNILSGLSSLKEFCGKFLRHQDISHIQVLSHIRANIRQLKVWIHMSTDQDMASVAPFIDQFGQYLEVLDFTILRSNNTELVNQFFIAICNGCPALKRLTINSKILDTNIFTENISKLKNLRHLTFREVNGYDNLYMNVNAIKAMPSLQTLRMDYIHNRSTQWTEVANVWPNMWRLSLSLERVECECGLHARPSLNACPLGISQYLECVSHLPRMTRLDLMNSLHIIGDQHLNAFIELKTLSFPGYSDRRGLPHLIAFMQYCEANRVTKTPLKLLVDKDYADELVTRLQDMGFTDYQFIQLNWC